MMRTVHNMWKRTGLVLGAVILACGFAGAGSAAAAPLGQEGTGTITGQVLSLDDVALPNVKLAAFNQPQEVQNRTPLAEFQTDAQGQYSVQVPAGTVWVEFLTQDIAGRSFWGYSNLPVNVAAGQTVTGQDFRVAIRVVSEPLPVVQQPPAVEAPGMPRTGTGGNLALPLAGVLGLVLLLSGMLYRRTAPR
ncbi:MAG TPA: carboxypeptidase-like regulatory domain-containing protein, partial [Chloroflexia bacterium]|nr:carboxypeptidase-like regulatory domain-containing protein [Chloroflexia bacterium]